MKKISNYEQEYIYQKSAKDKRNYVQYKKDHEICPILILPNNNLLIYTNNVTFKKIQKYIISFSQPIYRPQFMHQYKITKFSLYTAMVLEFSSIEIIKILKQYSKNLIFPKSLEQMIISYMKYCGKVRLILRNKQYQLITIDQISYLLGDMIQKIQQIDWNLNQNIYLKSMKQQLEKFQKQEFVQKKLRMIKFRIKDDYFKITQTLISNSIPLVQQYDFQNDSKFKLDIQLKDNVKLRFYQERAIRNVIIDNKARSGIIILPCGAGKSLVAILILQRIKSNAIIFCESDISMEQWKQQLLKWTTISANKIIKLSGKCKQSFNPKDSVIFLTTYNMVGRSRQSINDTLKKTQQIQWGVCIADQVHKLPAQTFQNVLRKYYFNVKIGLTATPYREDNKIDYLFYMIGPKLYQENWLTLVDQGCLAKPYCVQIRCKMTKIFKDHYQLLKGRQLIHTANPTKFKVLQYLLKIHQDRGDKILVFCDRPKILQFYAKTLKYAIIHGDVNTQQRRKIYNLFKRTRDLNVIFLSRVGDTAIDLPCANVAIQIGIHYKSRRQQIQRLGRIMRAKQNPNNQYNAFFYTLVSLDTHQVLYSNTRQKCLINQGFQYQILMEQDLQYNKNPQKHMYLKQIDQITYLTDLLVNHEQGNLMLKQISKQENKTNIRKDISHIFTMEYKQYE